ncbi:MAG: hypothetical protein QM478_05745 [Flavobacteriaceae bacterium]
MQDFIDGILETENAMNTIPIVLILPSVFDANIAPNTNSAKLIYLGRFFMLKEYFYYIDDTIKE